MLLPRALRSISLQTRRADHVLVLLSHVSLDACGTLQHELSSWLPGAELACDRAESTAHTRGANRNRGGALCALRSASHVAFLDADDEMYPSRLQRMLSLMREYDADLGLHSYVFQSPTGSPQVQAWDTNGDRGAESRIRGPNEVRAGVRKSALQGRTLRNTAPLLPFDTHHGHVVVRLSTLTAVPQRKDLRTGEDATFVFDVVKAGHRAVHTSERLTVYHQGASIGGISDDRIDALRTPRWLRFWDFRNHTWSTFRVGGGGGNASAALPPLCFAKKYNMVLLLQDETLETDARTRCKQRFLSLDDAMEACDQNRVWCGGITMDGGLKCPAGKLPYELRSSDPMDSIKYRNMRPTPLSWVVKPGACTHQAATRQATRHGRMRDGSGDRGLTPVIPGNTSAPKHQRIRIISSDGRHHARRKPKRLPSYT